MAAKKTQLIHIACKCKQNIIIFRAPLNVYMPSIVFDYKLSEAKQNSFQTSVFNLSWSILWRKTLNGYWANDLIKDLKIKNSKIKLV